MLCVPESPSHQTTVAIQHGETRQRAGTCTPLCETQPKCEAGPHERNIVRPTNEYSVDGAQARYHGFQNKTCSNLVKTLRAHNVTQIDLATFSNFRSQLLVKGREAKLRAGPLFVANR